jgi:hypothetical protein
MRNMDMIQTKIKKIRVKNVILLYNNSLKL